MSWQQTGEPGANSEVFTVSALNRSAKSLLERAFPQVFVEGEISNFSVPASGHWYLTLKDWKGRPCCDGQDCRPTRSRVRNGRLEVLIDGEWTKVPPHKVLSEASPDLRTHVCSPGPGSNYPRGFIFCVVLGSGV